MNHWGPVIEAPGEKVLEGWKAGACGLSVCELGPYESGGGRLGAYEGIAGAYGLGTCVLGPYGFGPYASEGCMLGAYGFGTYVSGVRLLGASVFGRRGRRVRKGQGALLAAVACVLFRRLAGR